MQHRYRASTVDFLRHQWLLGPEAIRFIVAHKRRHRKELVVAAAVMDGIEQQWPAVAAEGDAEIDAGAVHRDAGVLDDSPDLELLAGFPALDGAREDAS